MGAVSLAVDFRVQPSHLHTDAIQTEHFTESRPRQVPVSHLVREQLSKDFSLKQIAINRPFQGSRIVKV